MPVSSCCPRCGVELSPSATQTTDVPLCPACSATDAAATATPWWVEAAPSVPPPSSPPPPSPPPRRLRRWLRAAAALIALLVAGWMLFPRSHPGSAEAPAPQVSSAADEHIADAAVSAPASAEESRSSPVTLKPRPIPLDQPASNAKSSSKDDPAALAASTPPPLPTPPAGVKHDAPAKRAAPSGLHQLDFASEEDLRRQAATAPEIGLGSSGPAILNSYLTKVPANQVALTTPNLTDAAPLLDVRPDLRMLPINFGDRCKLNGRLTAHLDVLSRRLRVYLDTFNKSGPDGERQGTPAKLYQTLVNEKQGKKPAWRRAEAVPPLLQILMGEETPFRLMLVDLLAQIDASAATTALAQRAVFDLSPQVRQKAVAALKDRPAAEYRKVLLKALRYPWAAPAQHAAEAIVALKDSGAVPVLVSLLKLPDPAGPLTIHKDRHILQDVVRLNHLNNCMMCHPPAAKATDPVLGIDPVVMLPVTLQTPPMIQSIQQIQSGGGGHGSSGPPITVARVGSNQVTVRLPLLIRGDITYLRQDFTVRQPVGTVRPNQGTNVVRRQRFDYVLRTRILPRKLYEKIEEVVGDRPSYPQRDAILFALRELTGKDAGTTTEAWVQMFPSAETDVEALRLGRQIAKANDLELEVMLAKCRDGKGVVYTQALANAIPHLQGVIREHARGMLAERLTRMSAKTLRDYLQDEDPEIRRAAVLACGRKKKTQVVPELIALLDDAEPVTSHLAEAELASITGEHLKHPAAWKDWWKKHGEQAAPE